MIEVVGTVNAWLRSVLLYRCQQRRLETFWETKGHGEKWLREINLLVECSVVLQRAWRQQEAIYFELIRASRRMVALAT